MNELTTTSILALFQTNKDQRASFVNDIVSKIESGEVDPLKIHLQLKCMEDIITQLTSSDPKKNKNIDAAKKYKDALLDAAQNQGGKSFQFHNAKFEIKEKGVKYHFENTNDFFLQAAEEAIEPLNKSIKARQDFLKTIPTEGIELLNESTGEMVRVYPPYKTSSTSLQLSLK